MKDKQQGLQGDQSISLAWNVNLQCILGASIGIVALFLVWIYEPPNMPGPPSVFSEPSIVFMITHQYLYYGAAVVFLLGTTSAFVTPLGGIMQSGSLAYFAFGVIDSGNDLWLDGIDPQQTLRIGMYLGIVSCTLVLTSLFAPLGIGNLRPGKSRKLRLMERLLTITPSIVEKRP